MVEVPRRSGPTDIPSISSDSTAAIIQHPRPGSPAGTWQASTTRWSTTRRQRNVSARIIFRPFSLQNLKARPMVGATAFIPKDYLDERALPDATIVASGPGEATSTILADKSVRKSLGIRACHLGSNNRYPRRCAILTFWAEMGQNRNRLICIKQVPPRLLAADFTNIPSPFTRKKGTLTEPRAFNLMLDTYPGPIRDEDNKAYLRPETAQGIFTRVQKRRRHHPGEGALRRSANRQEFPQRSYPAELHLPLSRVRADGDGVFLPAG